MQILMNLVNKKALYRCGQRAFFKLASPGGFAHFGLNIMFTPASAPLRALTRPSMAAFQTLSLRLLRFESPDLLP